MSHHPWIRLRHGNTAISCDRCCQISPLPENQSIDRFAETLHQFTAQHHHCEPDWTKYLIDCVITPPPAVSAAMFEFGETDRPSR
jgi:hypothetical protein